MLIIIDSHVEESSNETRREVGNGFISYFNDCFKSFEAGLINTSGMVSNLSAAIVLQLILMESSGVAFREESAVSLNDSESCSTIQKLIKFCILHLTGTKILGLSHYCRIHFCYFFQRS